MRFRVIVAILILAGAPVFAHRLDEYLQAALLTIEKDEARIQMILTPGVLVLPQVIRNIDTDGNREISGSEQRAYAKRVLQDVSITVDGLRLTPQMLSFRFPSMAEMTEGQGEIQLGLRVDLPRGGRKRQLSIENHHQSGIGVYQVNCLVPGDADIQIVRQDRDYTQSRYQLEYERIDLAAALPLYESRGMQRLFLAAGGLLLIARLMIAGRRLNRPNMSSTQ
jgi:hypothetical protein